MKWLKTRWQSIKMWWWARKIAKVTRRVHELNAALMACSEAWRKHVESFPKQQATTVYVVGDGLAEDSPRMRRRGDVN